MGWLVPENVLDDCPRSVIDYNISEGHLCITGFLNSGKSLSIMFLTKKIICSGASVLVITYRNIIIVIIEKI
jgi:hypothetical protein